MEQNSTEFTESSSTPAIMDIVLAHAILQAVAYAMHKGSSVVLHDKNNTFVSETEKATVSVRKDSEDTKGGNKHVTFVQAWGFIVDPSTGDHIQFSDTFACSQHRLLENGAYSKASLLPAFQEIGIQAWRNRCGGDTVTITVNDDSGYGSNLMFVTKAGTVVSAWLLHETPHLPAHVQCANLKDNEEQRCKIIGAFMRMMWELALEKKAHGDLKPLNLLLEVSPLSVAEEAVAPAAAPADEAPVVEGAVAEEVAAPPEDEEAVPPESMGMCSVSVTCIDWANSTELGCTQSQGVRGTNSHMLPILSENRTDPTRPFMHFLPDLHAMLCCILLFVWNLGDCIGGISYTAHKAREILKLDFDKVKGYFRRPNDGWGLSPHEYREMLKGIKTLIQEGLPYRLTQTEDELVCYISELLGNPTKHFKVSGDSDEMCPIKYKKYLEGLESFVTRLTSDTRPLVLPSAPYDAMRHLLHQGQIHCDNVTAELQREQANSAVLQEEIERLKRENARLAIDNAKATEFATRSEALMQEMSDYIKAVAKDGNSKRKHPDDGNSPQ